MVDSIELSQESLDLEHAVGRCVLAWSKVEFSLSVLFCAILATDSSVAHATFAAVRSFAGRLKMLHDAFSARYPDPDSAPRSDWKLLYNKCSACNDLRNQVAHSFQIVATDSESGKPRPLLEPYFELTASKPRINLKEVNNRIFRFHELRDAVEWLLWSMGHVELQPPELTQPVPGLVLRLRDEAARNRAKQKPQPRSSPGKEPIR